MKNYFKRLFGEKKKEFMFTTRNIARTTGNGDRISQAGNIYSSGFMSIEDISPFSGVTGTFTQVNNNAVTKLTPADERIIVEPKAVFDEIQRSTPDISFENLESKITSVEGRIKVLKDHMTDEQMGDEHRTLFYLKNRKKYIKTRTKDPLDWAMTTSEAVDDLCKRYKLKVVPLKQYYTLVPKEGVEEMARYTKAYKAITGDVPIFELVIKDTEVKAQKKKDRDPILLANSPLGNFLFILGAWDDEVEIVDEIIYGSK